MSTDILLDYPFSEESGSKVRPALVVQNDGDNRRLTNTIDTLITKNTSRSHEPTLLLIDLSAPEGRQSGLNQTSVVVCTNLFTVSQTRIVRAIGSLPATVMTRIDDCLKAALALS